METVKYVYEDETGGLLYEKVRNPDKTFLYRRTEGEGKGYIYTLDGVKKVLYRLPELVLESKKEKSRALWFTEGEKDVNSLMQLGFVATTSGSVTSWKPEFEKYFYGLDVIVCEDNDEPGKEFSEMICNSLSGTAASIRRLTFHDQKPGYDVSDYIENGGTRESLEEQAKALPEWKPAPIEKPKSKPKTSKAKSGKTPSLSLGDLLAMLENVKVSGKGHNARCPAHSPDRKNSLSVREDDGKILLFCFAGCEFTAIVDALGVDPQQLFPEKPETVKDKRTAHESKRLGSDSDTKYECNDYTVACRLLNNYGHNMRFVYPCDKMPKLHIFNEKYWQEDDGELIQEYFNEITNGDIDLLKEKSGDAYKMVSKWVGYIKKQPSRNSAISMASKAFKEVKIRKEQLDTDPMLLTVKNGTIDLMSGKLKKHDRDDFITHCCPVEYHPGTESRDWNKFLADVIPDKELLHYIQKVAGYALTGSNAEEKCFFVYGKPATGKSTFLDAISATMGDYATSVPFNSFVQQKIKVTDARPDLALMQGRRLVCALEVDKGQKINESLLNSITGGDDVFGRQLYGTLDNAVARATYKIFFAANNQPDISNSQSAIWRRLKMIPFEEIISVTDANVKAVLRDPKISGNAILNWLVEGCLMWQKEGLKPEPKKVIELTEKYRESSNPLAEFLKSECKDDENESLPADEIYARYKKYAEENKYSEKEIWTSTRFGKSLSELYEKVRLYDKATKITSRTYEGIRFKTEAEKELEIDQIKMGI